MPTSARWLYSKNRNAEGEFLIFTLFDLKMTFFDPFWNILLSSSGAVETLRQNRRWNGRIISFNVRRVSIEWCSVAIKSRSVVFESCELFYWWVGVKKWRSSQAGAQRIFKDVVWPIKGTAQTLFLGKKAILLFIKNYPIF